MPLNRHQRRTKAHAERKAARILAARQPQQRAERKPFTFAGLVAITAAEGDAKLGTFEGTAYTGEPMKPMGWWTPVIIDLAGVKVRSQARPVLRQHDHEQIVGHTTSVTVDDDGIKMAGVMSGEKQHTDKVAIPARNGFQWQLSVGADPIRSEFLEAGEETEVNGRTITGPMQISRETEINEISFVPLGADGDTSAIVNAQKGKPMKKISVKARLKKVMAAGLTAAGITYTDDEIDKMSVEEAKSALKKCMADDEPDGDEAKAADDDKKEAADDEEKDKDKKADSAKATAALQAQAKAIIDKLRDDTAAEYNRQSAIAAAAKAHGVTEIEVNGKKVNLVAHAIENKWDATKTELEAMRAARPGPGAGMAPHVYVTNQPELNAAVLECAVFDAMPAFRLFDDDFYKFDDGEDGRNGKRRLTHRQEREIKAELNSRYTDQVRQAAHTRFKGRIGLQQMLTILASANGYRGPETFNNPGSWGEVANYLGSPIRADSASSFNTPATLANVQNKFMLQGYLYTEQAFMDIVQILPVKDLKPTKSVQLFGDFQFQPLNPSGEIQHGSVGDNPYANQADLLARMITIPLTYIINDDLGMFGQVPMMLGRGWGLKINDLVWTNFLAPGKDDGGTDNFFNATHNNLPTGQTGNSNLTSGAGSAMSKTSLTTVEQLFLKQIDPAGKPLGVDPEILVFPPELKVTALELMNAEFIIMAGLASTAAASYQPNTNIWKGRFKPVMSRYLSNTAYTGNSTTAWYLLANPNIIPVIQIAALNGQMTPVVQTAGQDWQFNMLGISMRGWGGAGANPQNFRGGVKSNGV